MTAARDPLRRRRHRRQVAVVSLLVIGAFAVGIALGEALHDNPHPGDTQTVVLTFKP